MPLKKSANEIALGKLGYLEEDFKRPLVGIIYASGEIKSTNSNLKGILESAQNSVIAHGGNAVVLACPTLGCGILNADKYELPAREIIADTTESYCIENGFDAVLLISDNDYLASGLIMGASRFNIATAYISTVPGKMPCIAEVLGISLKGNGTFGSFSKERLQLASMTGRALMSAFNSQITIKKVITKDSLKNALKFNLASISSINILINLFAIALELKISEKDFGVDMLNQTSDSTPTLCKFCSGFYEKLNAAGGVSAVLKELNSSKLPLLDSQTISGETIFSIIKKAENTNDEFVKKLDSPYSQNSSLVLVKGNLAENGAFCRRLDYSKDLLTTSGPAKVYDSYETAQYAITNGAINSNEIIVVKFEGAKGSGIREMEFSKLIKKAGLSNIVMISDGRIKGELEYLALSCVSPEGLNGGNIGVIQNGDIIELNIPRLTVNLKVSSKDLDKRHKQTQMPEKQPTSYLKRYSASVSDSVKGAYLTN